MNTHSSGRVRAWLSLLVGVSSADPIRAQVASASDNEEVVMLERFVTIGSYIPYAAEVTATPVTVITAEDIARTGKAGDLLEVIRKSSSQFIGNGNLGSSNADIGGGSTNGGAQLKLRNVPTLVLIDGRRAAFAPASASGGFTFVDINSIPIAAVERIEILSDGSSALYGSDAVSGVVNIVLKNDYEGAEIGGRYSIGTGDGSWEERSARVVVGQKNGPFSFTVAAEMIKTDPIFGNQRPFSADQTHQTTAFPGSVFVFSGIADPFFGAVRLAPGLQAPPPGDSSAANLFANGTYLDYSADDISALFNLSPHVTLGLGNERKAATISFEYEFAPSLTLFGNVLAANTRSFQQLAAQPLFGMPFGADSTYMYFKGFGYTLAAHPQNPFLNDVLVLNRFVDYPRQYFNDTDSLHAVAGLRGDLAADGLLSFETAVNLNAIGQDYTNTNLIDRTVLAAAIDAGTINLFANEQASGALETPGLFGTATAYNKSTLHSWDGRFFGEIPDLLPSGPLGYAIGAEYRRETLSSAPDAGSYAVVDPLHPLFGQPVRWEGASTADPFDQSRTIESLFAEIRVPIFSPAQRIRGLHTLELDVAARYDRYSDTDDPLVPKISLRYLPIDDQLAFRASYSESFTAPALYTLFGPTALGFSSDIDGLVRLDGGIIAQGGQAFVRLPPNPDLAPEEAKTYSAGLVFSPRGLKGLSVEITYFSIREVDIPGLVSEQEILQDVELKGPASPYADRVRIDGFAGTPITAPGDISAVYDTQGSFAPIYITNPVENIVSAEQDGLDFTLDYTAVAEPLGRFNFRLNGIWFNEFSVEDSDFVGTTNGSDALNGGTIPRWQGSVHLSVERAHWSWGGSVLYIPGVKDTQADPPASVSSYGQLDLWTAYAFPYRHAKKGYLDGLTLTVGVDNAFDKMPPPAPQSWRDANADTGTYGFLGRVIYVDASYKF